MPHLEGQVINRYLKEICKDAGIVTLPLPCSANTSKQNLTIVEKITDKYYYFD